jgi:glycosyltransferase involved in cell wall biosynthesis
MKVALIHDHLAQDGGAEKVLKVLAELYPQADIYTLLYEKKQADKYFSGRTIKTSFIQRIPGGVKHYRWFLPLMPMAVEFFDLSDYDLVISDASAFAKGVITNTNVPHICYCHTPTRYLWDYTHRYIAELHYNKFLKKIVSLFLNYLRLWDRQAADRVDYFIANSKLVQKRIKKYYSRDSQVIYPPVDIDNFQPTPKPGEYFLTGGRVVVYKRFDLVVEAFKQLGWPLKIFGDGVDLSRLKKIAKGAANIEFLGRVGETEKIELYQNCRAFLNPQEEDFGITVVEAMASGRPVIAYAQGGALETVIDGQTGIFFSEQTVESLMAALRRFDSLSFDSAVIRHQAEEFSRQEFEKQFQDFVVQALADFNRV